MIELKNVTYKYENNSAENVIAVKDVSVCINDGEFWGIIGHTGSGKSTLTELMGGLLKATEGTVAFDGEDIKKIKNPVRTLRGKVGMVFQYPEHQLFEESVIEDVCFGPKNMGLSREECTKRAKEAMRLVGIGEEYESLSPFELSGGEKRRVAIAGVVAMHPDVLILDEPTAGLDPKGRDSLLEMLVNIKGTLCKSIVLVSHSMEDVANVCDKVLVMNHGSVLLKGNTREVFAKGDVLTQAGLDVPQITRLVQRLNEHGYGLDENLLTVDEAADAIYKKLREMGKC